MKGNTKEIDDKGKPVENLGKYHPLVFNTVLIGKKSYSMTPFLLTF